MVASNGYEIRGVRKFILGIVFAVGVLISCTALCWSGKITGQEYNAGLTTAGLTIAFVTGANAAQKFARKE
jgi:hypothetical protein